MKLPNLDDSEREPNRPKNDKEEENGHVMETEDEEGKENGRERTERDRYNGNGKVIRV